MAKLNCRIRYLLLVLLLLGTAIAAAQDKSISKPEIVSLLGVKQYAKADDKGEVAAAHAQVAADPKNVERLLALGKAQAGQWRFNDAIATYTRALEIAPANANLYRQRGHRYISIRRFDLALADLKRASQLDDDAFDIWYHLGLAHYLRGEFAEAHTAYEKCYMVAKNRSATAPADKEGRDDSLIAVSDWLYMTNRRLYQTAEAAKILEQITPDSKVKENKSYFTRLLFYKGLKKEDDLVNAKDVNDGEVATVAYGVGNWHLYNGNRTKAEEYFRRIVAGKSWPSFGFIAAEVELSKSAKP